MPTIAGLTLCTMPSDYTDDLRLAHVLADDADSTSQARFKALDLHVMTKPDLTPVTDADKSVEEGIRRTLSRARPATPCVGEETGSTGHSQRRWVVDPIDGTKNFVRGVPVWATLISLMVDDEVVVGVVSAPMLNRRWWAMKDGGAWTGKSLLRATACQVSDVSRVEDASLSYSSLSRLGRARPARRLPVAVAPLLAHPGVRRLLVLHARRRGGGRHRHRAQLELYDMAALDVIVREAGGVLHLARRRARSHGRQRPRHQRQAARPGARVPGLAPRPGRPAARRAPCTT